MLEKRKNDGRKGLILTLAAEAATLLLGLYFWLNELGKSYALFFRVVLYLLLFFPIFGILVWIYSTDYEMNSEKLTELKTRHSIPQKSQKPPSAKAYRIVFWILTLVGTFFLFNAPQKQKDEDLREAVTSHSYSPSYTTQKNTYTTRKNTYTTRKPYYEQNDPDPYEAKDYGDPDDFYYWHEDDFCDYEEAEDYYYDHND